MSKAGFDVIIPTFRNRLRPDQPGFFIREFYGAVKQPEPRGIVTVQSDNASSGCMYGFPAIVSTLKSVFPLVRPTKPHTFFRRFVGFHAASLTDP